MGVFARSIKHPLNVSVGRSKYAHSRQQHRCAIFGRLDQHVTGKPPFQAIVLGFRKLLDEIGRVLQRSRWRAARKWNWLVERTIPGHDTTPRQNGDSSTGS
jgi:hypothetical protein